LIAVKRLLLDAVGVTPTRCPFRDFAEADVEPSEVAAFVPKRSVSRGSVVVVELSL
jgi:hypothetical protein